MTQTHHSGRYASVWDARANEFERRLQAVLAWARQNGAEAQGRCIDLRIATTFAGVAAIAFDHRLPVSGGDGATTFDLAGMPDELGAPLRSYVEETGGYDPALPANRQSSNTRTLHSYVLMTAGKGLTERLA